MIRREDIQRYDVSCGDDDGSAKRDQTSEVRDTWKKWNERRVIKRAKYAVITVKNPKYRGHPDLRKDKMR